MKKVSVIIPLFNSLNYIKYTLNSFVNQTYQNIEAIIIDDHSTDGSFELAKTFESDNIKVVKNKSKGACAARNFGFQLSSGDYIQYLDADDLLNPEKIEKQVKILEEVGGVFVASAIWGRFYDNRDDVVWENQRVNKSYFPSYNWLLDSWTGNGTGQTAIWLTPRKIIEKAGDWNENLKINQDGEFFSRVLMLTKGIKFCNEGKVYYRSGNLNSISQNQKFSREKAESLLLSYQLYREHAIHFGLVDELKDGLGQIFLMFIYQFYEQFEDLSGIAENEFYSLGHHKMWPVGGLKFKKLASLIGFKAALKSRKLLSK